MAKKRNRVLSMRKIREILRLSLACNIAHREIARSCSISHVTVGNYIRKVKDAGITYEELEKMDDVALSRLLGCGGEEKVIKRHPEPDWSLIHKEMRKPGVTCQLLWQEYKDAHPDGYQSTQFYEHYNQWKKTLKLSMRQVHKAGEKMFVDYAGKSLSVINPHTGEIKQVEIFVAVLGASNYTYTEATWDQTLPNWIGSHVRAFEYFRGVPKVIVPDNLLTGVSRAYSNYVSLQHAQHEFSDYLHFIDKTDHVSVGDNVGEGHHLADIGKTGTGEFHLHFAVTNLGEGKKGSGGAFVKIPAPFCNYEYSEDQGTSWKHVIRGIPLEGQWVRRAVSTSPVRFSAVWRPSAEGEIQVYDWAYKDFRVKYDELWPKGWRLKILAPYVVNGRVLYAAVWRPGSEGELQVYGWEYADLRAKYDGLWNHSLRLTHLSPYVI